MGEDTEAFFRVVEGRRSIRRFKPDRVPEESVQRVLEAARCAPTAANRQAFRLLVVRGARVKAAMARAVASELDRARGRVRNDDVDEFSEYTDNFMHFAQAPLVIAPIYRGGVDLFVAATGGGTSVQAAADALASVAAVITHISLAAHALGLGTCWMTGPLIALDELQRILAVPAGWSLAAIVPLGYALDAPGAPPRRPLSQLVRDVHDSGVSP